MSRIVFPDCTQYMASFYDSELRALVPELAVDIAQPSAEAFVARLADAVAVMHFGTRITARMLDACPKLRIIVFLGTGVGSWVDLPAAEARGLRVRRVLGYADRTVAEHALALILGLGRNLAYMDRELRAGHWRTEARFETAGKRLGIIGLGGIGRALAQLAAPLGFEVVAWNRSPVPADVPCRILPLDEVITSADIVSLHLGLNDQTRGIIDRRRIGLLKPGAVLINTARGGLLDQAALLERLQHGDILAGLDVFAEEPLAPEHPIVHLDNVILTAHAGWMSPEAGRRLFRLGLQAMREELDQLDDDAAN
jgi:D-3-phosphoglycerate dehydrogenase / 2-oxoglutarate reductase